MALMELIRGTGEELIAYLEQHSTNENLMLLIPQTMQEESKIMANLTNEQKKILDDTIKQKGLNEFGDPKSTMYAGGTPLFNEMTGQVTDRYDYIVKNHRDWLPQSK